MKYRVLCCALAVSLGFGGCAGQGGEPPATAHAELPESDAKALTRFWLDPADNPGLSREVHAEIVGESVALTLPAASDVRALAPRITHTGRSVQPGSGERQDFSQSLAYRVIAADGSSTVYTVAVSLAAPAEVVAPPVENVQPPPQAAATHEITAFAIAGVPGMISGDSIHVSLPAGTDLSALTPDVSYRGASLSPASGAAQSFSAPVTYTVTAEDGSTRSYAVSISLLPSSSKQITRFTIAGVPAEITSDAIRLTVPFGTRIVNITPRVEHSGTAISPAPGTLSDFSQPVVFTVTAQDGSRQTYTVYVKIAPNLGKEITHFMVFGIDAEIVDERIQLTLPHGTVRSSLVPVITLSGGTVEPASGVAQDFTGPVAYTVTAQDGSSRTYVANVSVAPSNACSINAFRVPGAASLVGSDSIRLLLPYGGDVRALAPLIVHEGASVQPPSGVAQDFTRAVIYRVTAADGTQRSYSVSASTAETSGSGIVRFSALGQTAAISGDDISLTLPSGANLSALTPEIVHHGARLTPGSGVPQSFDEPVRYNLLELDGRVHVYTVRVARAASSDASLTGLSVLGRAAHLSGSTLTLELPFGTALDALNPVVTHLGARVSPVSGTLRDLRRDVVYTVIAADGTRRDYTLRTRAAAADEKRLLDFALLGVPASVDGDQVHVRLPAGTDVRALSPSLLQHNGASLDPAADQPRDFTQPVSYVVTAADGSSVAYQVHVTLEP